MNTNFTIYTDSNGKLPALKPAGESLHPDVASHHRCWVEYRNNKPVRVCPFDGQSRVWDYSKNVYVDICSDGITIVNH